MDDRQLGWLSFDQEEIDNAEDSQLMRTGAKMEARLPSSLASSANIGQWKRRSQAIFQFEGTHVSMKTQEHWDQIYRTKAPDQVSWYSPHLSASLELIERASVSRAASIIDIGGGESTLVDDLLTRGYQDITVLDVSQTAIDANKERLGKNAERVRWLAADITKTELKTSSLDVWHDRAVFHFLTVSNERAAYVRLLAQALKPGGHVIIGTFGMEGPARCSGLDVVRYDAKSLHDEFGKRFRLVESTKELHHTPFGTTQQFLYCYCRFE